MLGDVQDNRVTKWAAAHVCPRRTRGNGNVCFGYLFLFVYKAHRGANILRVFWIYHHQRPHGKQARVAAVMLQGFRRVIHLAAQYSAQFFPQTAHEYYSTKSSSVPVIESMSRKYMPSGSTKMPASAAHGSHEEAAHAFGATA